MNSNELREKMAALPQIDEDKAPPHTWPRHQLSIRRHTAQDEPDKFLGWSTIVATMFVGNGAKFIDNEVNELTQRYHNILREPYFGQPELMTFSNGIWPVTTSANLVHQAYHLMQFERSTGVQVNTLDSIVEFGGGYGAMVVLCRRLGFKGTYTIIDLPEFSLLQEYYLSNTIGLKNVTLIDDWAGEKMQTDLLMAVYSLSEVSLEFRATVLSHIEAKHLFLAHQDLYTLPSGEQVNNVEEFEKIAGQFKLSHRQNDNMPGHWYLS